MVITQSDLGKTYVSQTCSYLAPQGVPRHGFECIRCEVSRLNQGIPHRACRPPPKACPKLQNTQKVNAPENEIPARPLEWGIRGRRPRGKNQLCSLKITVSNLLYAFTNAALAAPPRSSISSSLSPCLRSSKLLISLPALLKLLITLPAALLHLAQCLLILANGDARLA